MEEKLQEIVSVLDKQASTLQEIGRSAEAEALDSVSNSLEKVIASNETEVKEYDTWYDRISSDGLSFDELVDLFGYREAAEKKKKKWIPKDLEEGRLTKYKKPGESMADAARRAIQSPDKSVQGMGRLFLNVFAKGKRKRKQKGKQKD
jgi:hypothetical protein